LEAATGFELVHTFANSGRYALWVRPQTVRGWGDWRLPRPRHIDETRGHRASHTASSSSTRCGACKRRRNLKS